MLTWVKGLTELCRTRTGTVSLRVATTTLLLVFASQPQAFFSLSFSGLDDSFWQWFEQTYQVDLGYGGYQPEPEAPQPEPEPEPTIEPEPLPVAEEVPPTPIEETPIAVELASTIADGAVALPPLPADWDPGVISAADIEATDNNGTLQGNFRVNESGAATYSIEINTPAGTAGVSPQLGLVFSSQANTGIAGKGWQLSGLSTISRCRQTVATDGQALPIQWNDEDRFCLDGQRLTVVNGEYGAPGSEYKTEIDSYQYVTSHGGSLGQPDYFTVLRKDGSQSTYGAEGEPSGNSSEVGARDASGQETALVSRWSLSRFEDSVGNPINYDYHDDSDGHAIAAVRYAYGNTDTARAEIRFDYESRPDARQGFLAGYPVREARRLRSISVWNNEGNGLTELQHINLQYDTGEDHHSRLSQVQLCSPSGICQNPTRFDWADPNLGFSQLTRSLSFRTPSDRLVFNKQLADINGDGIADVIWQEGKFEGTARIHDQYWYQSLSGPDGFQPRQLVYSHSGNSYRPSKWSVIDYNADGRSDLILPINDRWHVFLSQPTGDGQWTISRQALPTSVTGSTVSFFDITGDGLVDAISSVRHLEIAVQQMEVNPNEPRSSSAYYRFSPSRKIQTFFHPYPDYVALFNRFEDHHFSRAAADFNGDGLADFGFEIETIQCLFGCSGPVLRPDFYITTADGGLKRFTIAEDPTGQFLWMPDRVPSRYPVQLLGDINGDGLTDLAYPSRDVNALETKMAFRLSNGEFFELPQFSPLALRYTDAQQWQQLAVRLTDVNEDGCADFVWFDADTNSLRAFLWDGAGNTFRSESIALHSATAGAGAHYFLADFNGDGEQDFASMNASRLEVNVRKGDAGNGQLVGITNGLGAQSQIEYSALSDPLVYRSINISDRTENCLDWPGQTEQLCFNLDKPDSTAFYSTLNNTTSAITATASDNNGDGQADPVLELLAGMTVVRRISSSAPAGDPDFAAQVDADAVSAISYRYFEGKYQALGRGSLGFAAVASIDEQSGVVSTTRYHQQYPLLGQPISLRTETDSGQLLKESRSEWSSKQTQGVWQILQTAGVEQLYALEDSGLLQGRLLSESRSELAHDAYGNIIRSRQEITADGSRHIRLTENQYGSDVWSQKMGRLISSAITNSREGSDAAAPISRHSRFSYHRSGPLAGLLASEVIEPDYSALRLESRHRYDGYGNRVGTSLHSADGNRCTSDTVAYEASGRYPSKQWDCGGHLISEVLERNDYGKETRAVQYLDTGAATKVSLYSSYTELGHLYHRYRSDGSWTARVSIDCDTGIGCPASAAFVQVNSSAGGGEVWVYHDSVGRAVRKASANIEGKWVLTDSEFNASGSLLRQSAPYFEGDSVFWNHYHYDLQQRVTALINADGSRSDSHFDGFTRCVTDDLGNRRCQTRDQSGAMVKATDSVGGELHHRYDAGGNLIYTTQRSADTAATVVTRIEFDRLGRKLALHDPDKGSWHYQYNAFGELLLQQDAKGQRTLNDYDAQGRIQRRQHRLASGSLDADIRWYYDTAANALGKAYLIEDKVTGFQRELVHDEFGRVHEVGIRPGPGLGEHYTRTTYDEFGRVFQQFDAARNSRDFSDNGIEMRYSRHGHLQAQVSANYLNGFPEHRYHHIESTDAYGNPTRETLAFKVSRNLDYHQNSGRLRESSTRREQVQLNRIRLQWDSVGNISRQDREILNTADASREEQWEYQYDALYRLTRTQQSSDNSHSETHLSYDGLGNILYKSDVGDYHYNGTQAHAPSSIAGVEYRYDANGNMVIDGNGRQITYSSFDKALGIDKNGYQISYQYGADGQRFLREDRKNSASRKTLYLGSVEKIENADGSRVWRRHLPGGLVINEQRDALGNLNGSTEHLVLKDHLGSTLHVIDSTGQVVDDTAIDPWGRRVLSEAVQQDAVSSPLNSLFDRIIDSYLNPAASSDQNLDPNRITARAFTGHEMLDAVDIIHMNGRIYDPVIARFLQADGFVQAPTDGQMYNRYSYVRNNPLIYADPSGHFIALIAGIAASSLGATATTIGFVVGVAATAEAMLRGASFSEALQSGIISGVTAGALSGLNGMDSLAMGTLGESTSRILVMGATGGISSTLQGGKFGHGFVTAGLGSHMGNVSGAKLESVFQHSSGQLIGRMLAGGTVTRMTGGKFANGAATVAFASTMTSISNSANAGRAVHTPSIGQFVEAQAPAMSSALSVDETRFAESKVSRGIPGAAPFSRQGLVEEVLVRGTRPHSLSLPVPPAYKNPTISASAFVASHYSSINRQQMRAFSYMGIAGFMVASPVATAQGIIGSFGVAEVFQSEVTPQSVLFGLATGRPISAMAGQLGAMSNSSVGEAIWKFNGEVLATGIGFAGP